jgi:hypothetical protein
MQSATVSNGINEAEIKQTHRDENDKHGDKEKSGQKLGFLHAAVRVRIGHAAGKKSRAKDKKKVYKHTA